MKPKPSDSLPACPGFNGLVLSSGTWAIVWGKNKKDKTRWAQVSKQQCTLCGLQEQYMCPDEGVALWFCNFVWKFPCNYVIIHDQLASAFFQVIIIKHVWE